MPSAVDWAVAQRVAVRVAGREPFSESYHSDSLESDFVELTEQAEALVAAETGLVSLAGPARARVTDRAGWINANVASFQRLLRPILEKISSRLTDSALTPVAQKLAGAEVGVVLGWMSTRVLGQYDLLIIEEESPLDQDLVYYVGPNVLSLEKQFAFPPREFRLWLALHEVTHRAQFTGIEWMRPYFLDLVTQTLDSVEPDPKRFLAVLGRLAEARRTGANPLADGGIMALVASDAQREVLDRVSGLMSLLEGHGDITMDRAGAGLVPSAERFSRVLRQRRESAQGLARLLQQLIGLEAKMNQYAQGERFIRAVEDVGGPSLLATAWESPDRLPTLQEIRDPASWIARVAPALAG
ncbi:MAG TPA: zinc-dependent metalloprotease [Acidimicrobiales bacterium]|nr:zinc-dependent metalloprotease [Acidimicrobiales bacterium]